MSSWAKHSPLPPTHLPPVTPPTPTPPAHPHLNTAMLRAQTPMLSTPAPPHSTRLTMERMPKAVPLPVAVVCVCVEGGGGAYSEKGP